MALRIWLPLTRDNDVTDHGTDCISFFERSKMAYSFGNMGRAPSFDYSSDHVILSESISTADYYFSDGDFSWSMWINKTEPTSWSYIFSVGRVDMGGLGYGMRNASATTAIVYFGSKQWAVTTRDGKWDLVTFVKRGTNIKIYVNAKCQINEAFSGTLPTYSDAGGIGIGCFRSTNGAVIYPYGGRLCDFRIYDEALSVMEIKDIYKACFLHIDFEDASLGITVSDEGELIPVSDDNATFYDESGNGNHIVTLLKREMDSNDAIIGSRSFSDSDGIHFGKAYMPYYSDITISVWIYLSSWSLSQYASDSQNPNNKTNEEFSIAIFPSNIPLTTGISASYISESISADDPDNYYGKTINKGAYIYFMAGRYSDDLKKEMIYSSLLDCSSLAPGWHHAEGILDSSAKKAYLRVDGILSGDGYSYEIDSGLSDDEISEYRQSMNAESIYTIYKRLSSSNKGLVGDIKVYGNALLDSQIDDHNVFSRISRDYDFQTYRIKELDGHGNLIPQITMKCNGKAGLDIPDDKWGRKTEADAKAQSSPAKYGLGAYNQPNMTCTITEDGYRLYCPAGVTTADHNNYGGLLISPLASDINSLQDNHSYIITFHIKGKSSRAFNNVMWNNNPGWTCGSCTARPMNVRSHLIPKNFNGEMDCYYKFTISDSVYKECTENASYPSNPFKVGETYVAYSNFLLGFIYSDSGELGTDLYITDLQMFDITGLDLENDIDDEIDAKGNTTVLSIIDEKPCHKFRVSDNCMIHADGLYASSAELNSSVIDGNLSAVNAHINRASSLDVEDGTDASATSTDSGTMTSRQAKAYIDNYINSNL